MIEAVALFQGVTALINASSTSGISLGTVLNEMQKDDPGEPLVVTLKGIREPDITDIIHSKSGLAKLNPKDVRTIESCEYFCGNTTFAFTTCVLKVSVDHSHVQIEYDRNNILRCAYLVHLAIGEQSLLTIARMETMGTFFMYDIGIGKEEEKSDFDMELNHPFRFQRWRRKRLQDALTKSRRTLK